MEKFIRLSFRIVAIASDVSNREELVSRIQAMISPIGTFRECDVSPYPKIPDSHLVRIEFDIAAPFESGIESVLDLVGGTGWHISRDDHEQEAIWASSDGLLHPFGKYFYWCGIQLFPHEQLATSNRASTSPST